MKKRLQQSEHGFTLVEMLVTCVIIGILSLTLANFITTWLQESSIANARANLLSNSEYALDAVTNDIRLSGSVDVNNRWPDANGPGGNQYGWASGSSTLILAKIATTKSNAVMYSDPAEYITLKDDEVYFLSGTTLYRRTLASGVSGDAAVTTCPASDATRTCPVDKSVATGVSSWTVSYYDQNGAVTTVSNARSVQLAITLSQKVDTQTISASYTTRMVFRND